MSRPKPQTVFDHGAQVTNAEIIAYAKHGCDTCRGTGAFRCQAPPLVQKEMRKLDDGRIVQSRNRIEQQPRMALCMCAIHRFVTANARNLDSDERKKSRLRWSPIVLPNLEEPATAPALERPATAPIALPQLEASPA